MEYREYLEFVDRTVRQNLKPGSSSITAAALGLHLSRAAPDTKPQDFGKRSLLGVLEDLELQGKVKRTSTDKGALAVEPISAGSNVDLQRPAPLRKAVWAAFALINPTGRRFMSRSNGRIVVGGTVAPGPAVDWLEIQPVTSLRQKKWAEEFSETLDAERALGVKALIENRGWAPHSFVQSLRQIDEDLSRKWNRYRTQLVVEEVTNWLSSHGLPKEWAYSTPSSEPAEPLLGVERAQHTRKLVLRALELMSTDQLLEISIPVKFLIAAQSKDKAP